MELKQLRYLIGVADAGSLLKASKSLHIAQPALGQYIVALEDELGVALFIRSSRGMTLTENGRRFVEEARRLLSEAERVKASVSPNAQQVSGEVLLGLPTTVSLAATLRIVREVRARLPGVRLRLVESHSGFLKEWLRDGRLDLCVLFAEASDSWLVQRPLLNEQLVLVGPAGGSSPSLGREIQLAELHGLPMMLPGPEHGLRRIIDGACAVQGIELDVVAELDSLPAIKTAVEAGLAFTILSPGAISSEVRDGRLKQAVIRQPEIARTICSSYALTRPPGPAARAVNDVVEEVIRSLVESGQWPARLESAGLSGPASPV